MGLKEYLFGFDSEERATEFLQNSGFEILDRNFKSRFGEIDIIAQKDEILHFIEVKSTSKDYEAIYRLTSSKLQKILKAVNFYLMSETAVNSYQIDLVVITKSSINLIENISI